MTQTRTRDALTQVDERVLIALSKLHYLTLEQFIRYFRYSNSSSNWLQREVLKPLVEKKYLYTQHLPRRESYGRNPYIYALANRGVTHLRGLEFDVIDAAEGLASFLYLEHSLRVTDVLIAASLLSDLVPEITLNAFKHDRTLHQYPTKITIGNKQVSVIPDAWIDFGVSPPYGNEGERVCVCIEVDRGTVDVNPFKQKIYNLCLFADGPYQTNFGTNSLTVAFIVSLPSDSEAHQRRVKQIQEWTTQALTISKKQQFADLFLFASLPPGVPDPLCLFTQPTYTTLTNSPVALIEKVL